MTDKQTYRLQDGVDRVVRSGLVLDGDDTIEAYSDVMDDHGDVLERVDDAGEDSTTTTDDGGDES